MAAPNWLLAALLLGACSSSSTNDTPAPSDAAASDASAAADSAAEAAARDASGTDTLASDDVTTSDAPSAADVACTEPSCAGLAVWLADSTGFDLGETGGLTARDWQFEYVAATRMLNANTRGGGASLQSRSVVSNADAQEILARLIPLRTVDGAGCVIDGTSFVITISGPSGARVFHDGASSGCGGTASKPPPWIGTGLDDLSSLLYQLAARAAADGG